MEGILRAWRTILLGRRPCLSIEITRECPLSCPGCYAYTPAHLGDRVTLRQVADYKGDELVDRVLELVDAERPLHVSIVGGEPLVRFRELNSLLPILSARGIHTQLVTSAVRPIPAEWAAIPRLGVVVSIDGLREEHDARRKPATYDRILRHIEGHSVTVHCTITRQQTQRPGYFEEFLKFWSAVEPVAKIWFSLYTPQLGEVSAERLRPAERAATVAALRDLAPRYPKLAVGPGALEALASPPRSPEECVFAQVTRCVSADLRQPVTPCQLGGKPDCANCGCFASAGLTAVGRHRLPGGVPVSSVFTLSRRVGAEVRRVRESIQNILPEKVADAERA
jgi:pyruvate-formate lyase-activating enzyme